MKHSNEILNELQSLSALLANTDKVNVFTVPDGYFNNLTERILIASTSELKHTDVPTGYFDTLADEILGKIKSQQFADEPISTLLNSIKNSNTFTVPDNYFDELPNTILAKIKNNQAKIVVMSRKSNVIRYAVAACITAFLFLGVYKFVLPKNNNPIVASTKLDPSIEAGKNMTKAQLDIALNNLSKDDIENYLEKNTDEKDIASLTNNIETQNLPNEEDYLVNDTTVSIYLNAANDKDYIRN